MKNKAKMFLSIILFSLGFTTFSNAAETDTSFESDLNTVIRNSSSVSYGNNYPITTKVDSFSIDLSNDEFHSGNRSLHVKSYYNRVPIFFEYDTEPDTLYEFSAFVKSDENCDNIRLSIYGDVYTATSDKGYISISNAFSVSPECFYRMDDWRDSVYSYISKKEWTEVKRYIYIPAKDSKLKKIRVGLCLGADSEAYIDDVNLSRADQSLLTTEMTAGPEIINSMNAGTYNYNAELLFKGSPTSFSEVNYQCPSVNYTLLQEHTGVLINSSTGELTVSEGVSADITIVATLSYNSFESKATKDVKIAPSAIPKITNIISDSIDDFSGNTLNYYDIESSNPPILDIIGDCTYTVENLNGILSGVRVTAKQGQNERIYNFYTKEVSNKYKNMIEDGDFEQGIGASNFQGVTAIDTTDETSYSGNYCALVSATTYRGPTQKVFMKSGKYYLVSFVCKVKDYLNNTSNLDINGRGFLSLKIGDNAQVISKDLTTFNKVDYPSQKVGTNEWVRFTTIVKPDEDDFVDVGLSSGSFIINVYIDDFYVSELNGSDSLENYLSDDNIGVINYQNSDKGKENISVILKSKSKTQDYEVFVAEYSSDGRLLSIEKEKILSEGIYLINTPTGDNKQKIFLWEMNTLYPAANGLSK